MNMYDAKRTRVTASSSVVTYSRIYNRGTDDALSQILVSIVPSLRGHTRSSLKVFSNNSGPWLVINQQFFLGKRSWNIFAPSEREFLLIDSIN